MASRNRVSWRELVKPNKLFNKIIYKLKNKIAQFSDKRLLKTKSVLDKNNTQLFKVFDYGELCRYRASSFLYKEPETIEWIDSFNASDYFLDIGANIGIYSLYAGKKGINTTCIEPDALNFALLNMNIKNNNFGKLVKAYLIALHDKVGFSELNLQKMQWGGALSSFNNEYNQFEELFRTDYSQGCYGDKLDNCIMKLSPTVNHIKIDVDGNENLILKGGAKTLRLESLKSLLIELDETRSDYESSISMIEESGFKLIQKRHSPMYENSKFSTTYNHIFRK